MTTYLWIDFGSVNGLLPDGTKPLPETNVEFLLTAFCHFLESNLIASTQATILYNKIENYLY